MTYLPWIDKCGILCIAVEFCLCKLSYYVPEEAVLMLIFFPSFPFRPSW